MLDLEEAALLLRVKPEVVRDLAEARGIPARRVGDQWRFTRSALLEWLKGEPATGTMRPGPERTGGLDRTETPRLESQALTGRGVMSVAPESPAQAPPATKPPPSTVGERPATPTTEEIALRDQRVLLKRGAATIDFSAMYGRSDQTLFPVIRVESRAAAASGTLRYGLRDDLQLTLRVPAILRRTAVFTDASLAGTNLPRIQRQGFAGGAAISLLGVASREAAGRPTIIWSLDGVAPAGTRDRGLGGGFVLSKSFDPAVLFAGLSYLHGLSVDPSDPRASLARHNYGFHAGYTYAVNETFALNTVLLGTYRNLRSPDGLAIPPPHERYDLQIGMTWLLAPNLFMEPAVAMQLGGDNPGLTLSLNFSRAFRWATKP